MYCILGKKCIVFMVAAMGSLFFLNGFCSSSEDLLSDAKKTVQVLEDRLDQLTQKTQTLEDKISNHENTLLNSIHNFANQYHKPLKIAACLVIVTTAAICYKKYMVKRQNKKKT